MFINELMNELRDLPYNEQQLMAKLNKLILMEYKKNCSSLGQSEALAKLKKMYDIIEKSFDNNLGDSIDTVKSK